MAGHYDRHRVAGVCHTDGTRGSGLSDGRRDVTVAASFAGPDHAQGSPHALLKVGAHRVDGDRIERTEGAIEIRSDSSGVSVWIGSRHKIHIAVAQPQI